MKEPINDTGRLIGRCNGMIHDADRDIHKSREREARMEKTLWRVNAAGAACAVTIGLTDIVSVPPWAMSQHTASALCFIVCVVWHVATQVVLAKMRRLKRARVAVVCRAQFLVVRMHLMADDTTDRTQAALLRSRAAYLAGVIDGTPCEAP